jgi:hypothetical protein
VRGLAAMGEAARSALRALADAETDGDAQVREGARQVVRQLAR